MQQLNGLYLPNDDKKDRGAILAELFADMKSDQQADFFNTLAIIVEVWPNHHGFQWAYMKDDLNIEGKRIINEINDHINGEEE